MDINGLKRLSAQVAQTDDRAADEITVSAELVATYGKTTLAHLQMLVQQHPAIAATSLGFESTHVVEGDWGFRLMPFLRQVSLQPELRS